MSAYIVTLAARATVRVWIAESASANQARLAAVAGEGENMHPWTPETKPDVRKVEKV